MVYLQVSGWQLASFSFGSYMVSLQLCLFSSSVCLEFSPNLPCCRTKQLSLLTDKSNTYRRTSHTRRKLCQKTTFTEHFRVEPRSIEVQELCTGKGKPSGTDHSLEEEDQVAAGYRSEIFQELD